MALWFSASPSWGCPEILNPTRACPIPSQEIDVFLAVKAWGEYHSSEQDRPIQEVLNNIIQRVRFALMSQDELFEMVEPSGVAPSKMIMDACRYQAIRKEAAMKECVRFRTGVNFSRATIEHLSWFQPVAAGDVPSPRSLHTATAVGKRLFIFGGQESGAPRSVSPLPPLAMRAPQLHAVFCGCREHVRGYFRARH